MTYELISAENNLSETHSYTTGNICLVSWVQCGLFILYLVSNGPGLVLKFLFHGIHAVDEELTLKCFFISRRPHRKNKNEFSFSMVSMISVTVETTVPIPWPAKRKNKKP